MVFYWYVLVNKKEKKVIVDGAEIENGTEIENPERYLEQKHAGYKVHGSKIYGENNAVKSAIALSDKFGWS